MWTLYFRPVLSLCFILFCLPYLSRHTHRLDVCHTSTHGVALLWMYNGGVKCAARGLVKIQDAKRWQKIPTWAAWHNFVGLYFRKLRHVSTIRKKKFQARICLPRFHNMVNFGVLVAVTIFLLWAPVTNVNAFCLLAALLSKMWITLCSRPRPLHTVR